MEFVDPVSCIGAEEFAHRFAMLAIEVNGFAPFILVTVGEVSVREILEVISVGTEMVVNHVEDDTQAECVGTLDEAAEVIRPAVQARGSKQINPIIAPAEAARELGNRHHFNRGYS